MVFQFFYIWPFLFLFLLTFSISGKVHHCRVSFLSFFYSYAWSNHCRKCCRSVPISHCGTLHHFLHQCDWVNVISFLNMTQSSLFISIFVHRDSFSFLVALILAKVYIIMPPSTLATCLHRWGRLICSKNHILLLLLLDLGNIAYYIISEYNLQFLLSKLRLFFVLQFI